eukprot:gene4062-4724_t
MTKTASNSNVSAGVKKAAAAPATTSGYTKKEKEERKQQELLKKNAAPKVEEVDELEQVQKQLKEFKVKSKMQREEHEKEIKKKLHNDNDQPQAGLVHETHSGVKRSKPLQPTPAFQLYKDANPTKSKGWCQEMWRALDDVGKLPFYTAHEEDKKRYQLEMANYEKIHAQVTHHKLQKKDKKKLAAAANSSEDEEGKEKPVAVVDKKKKKKKGKAATPEAALSSSPSNVGTVAAKNGKNEGSDDEHLRYDDDGYADEEDEGYQQMKRGFKSNAEANKGKSHRFGSKWSSKK